MKSACVSLAILIATSPTLYRSYAQTAPTVPANAWMKTPTVDGAVTPKETLAIREARDHFWDSTGIASKEVLTPEIAGSTAISGGKKGINAPQIPHLNNRAIIIASFQGFQSVLTSSRHAVYTNISFRVQDVVESAYKISQPEITLSIAGGTVQDLSGHVISYLTQPREMFLQPGKTYLLIVSYHPNEDFYTYGDDWDLTDGTAKPDNNFNKMRAEQGRSKIAGLSRVELVQSLKQSLTDFEK